MSQLRATFVGNAKSQSVTHLDSEPDVSRDDLTYTEYPRSAPYYSNELLTSQADDTSRGIQKDDFRFGGPYESTRYGSSESHELAELHDNPFERTNTHSEELNPFEHEPTGYSVAQESLGARNFESDQHNEKDALEKHMLRNERNRRKLQRRLPRFHYTKLPWFTIIVTTAQIIVFIVELVKMGIYTGSPFQTKPYFNPMLGPSTYVLINMGARYVPCMHKIDGITSDTSIQFPCPNSTSTDTDVCNLNELCGISGIPIVNNEFVPDQKYRVILPIFLHAGFLHIIFNLILQISMGAVVERCIGGLKYAIIYTASGVSGFLLGANFTPNGIASTGASGSLFGIIATDLLLFIYCGKKNTNIYETKRYKTFLVIMVAEILVSFVLGLLPGLDNFSHIGGFCMGILMSIALLPDPSYVYINGVYTYDADTPTMQLFLNNWNPLNKYKDKIPWKVFVWTIARVISIVLAIVYFVLLAKNLTSKRMEENKQTCSWCKYINCLPVHDWCEQGEVTVSTSGSVETSSATSDGSKQTASATVTTTSADATSTSDLFDPSKRYYEEEEGVAIDSLTKSWFSSSNSFNFLKEESVLDQPLVTEGSIMVTVVMAFLCVCFIRRLGSKHSPKI